MGEEEIQEGGEARQESRRFLICEYGQGETIEDIIDRIEDGDHGTMYIDHPLGPTNDHRIGFNFRRALRAMERSV